MSLPPLNGSTGNKRRYFFEGWKACLEIEEWENTSSRSMPCLLAILALAFPRVAIVLLWLFTGFFTGIYQSVIVPVLGFLFLPLTLIVYTYLQKASGGITTQGFVFLFIAVILDLGLLGGGNVGRRRRRISS